MRRLSAIMLLAASLVASGCKGADSGQIAAAAITVGAAVAAAGINRAVTDECWGNCTHGTMCDHESGRCIPIPELTGGHEARERWYPCDPGRFECAPDEWLVCDEVRCEWYQCDEAAETCDPRSAAACSTSDDCAQLLAGGPAPAAGPPFGGRAAADPCRGLCLSGERCVVQAGVADCVAASAPEPEPEPEPQPEPEPEPE